MASGVHIPCYSTQNQLHHAIYVATSSTINLLQIATMENLPPSLPIPKRAFNPTPTSTSDVPSHKSIYDDVFRAPPNLTLPALAPRLDDYSEIFGALHSSRSSAIPLLHLPLLTGDANDSAHLHFDYSEVFGELEGLASFEDMFGGGYVYDSPDDQWSPAQSESLFDELENRRLSDGEIQISLESVNQYNASSNKSSPRQAHVTHTNVVPPYTFSQYESSVSWDGEDEHYSMHLTNNVKHNEETKLTQSCSSTPLHDAGSDAHVSDFNPMEKHENSPCDEPFITVFDINLRTKPSNLPPPSRPPPALAVKVNDSFNMEENDSVFIERNGVENVEVKHESDKEYTDGMRTRCSADERFRCSKEEAAIASAPVIEEGIAPRKNTGGNSKYCELPSLSGITRESVGPVAWKERTTYIEVIENKINGQSFSMVEDGETLMQYMPQDNHRYQRGMDHEEFNQKDCSRKFVWSKEALGKNPIMKIEHTRWDEVNNPPEMSEVHFDCDGKHREEKQSTRSNGQMLSKLSSINDLGTIEHNEILKGLPKYVVDMHDAEASLDIKERFVDALLEENTRKRKQATLRVERWRKLEDVEREESPEKVQRGRETEEIEKQYNEAAKKEHDNKLEASKMKGSGVILKKNADDMSGANNSYRALRHEICGNEQRSQRVENGNESLMEAGKQNVNGLTQKGAIGDDENDKENMIHESGEESSEAKKTLNLSGDAGIQAKQSRLGEAAKPSERTEHKREHEMGLNGNDFTERDQVRIFHGQSKLDEEIASEFFGKDGIDQKKKINGPAFSSEGYEELKTEPNCIIYEAESRVDDILDKEKLEGLSFKKYGSLSDNCKVDSCLSQQMTDSSLCENAEVSGVVPNKECSQFKDGLANLSRTSTRDDESGKIKGTQFVNKKDDIRDNFTRCQETRNSTMYRNKVEDAPFKLEHIDNALYTIKPAGSQRVLTREKNIKENFDAKDQKCWERMKRDTELENDHIRKVEEEREREREREKDRMSVDKVALQAHERSNVEARKRAERAAVERTSAEVRLRTMAGIWERLEKSSVEARIKTERAKNERTSATAWQRGAEKSSVAFKSDDTSRNSLTTDLHFESTLNSSDLQHSNSSALFGAQCESPQRCKARLERYRRTTERAASALAEKNRRDLLAQREKEERNRVAEVLDPEIKRWSSGKEGNLRALLSTLQYIIGQGSGWQPVQLTEIITSAAVKRSYRKATLCVHPDKLQQRGATIQQKYICEKVFDLLKEAWSKFNSEEV